MELRTRMKGARFHLGGKTDFAGCADLDLVGGTTSPDEDRIKKSRHGFERKGGAPTRADRENTLFHILKIWTSFSGD